MSRRCRRGWRGSRRGAWRCGGRGGCGARRSGRRGEAAKAGRRRTLQPCRRQRSAKPGDGYPALTRWPRSRGKCCGSGCRHCCFDHANVRDKARHLAAGVAPRALPPAPQPWCCSGAAARTRSWRCENSSPTSRARDYSLTTFDASERRAYIRTPTLPIARQAGHGLLLLGVLLDRASGEATRTQRSGPGRDPPHASRPALLGDLHLEHIRGWREEALSGLGADLHFPLWHADYEDLSADLASPACLVTCPPRRPTRRSRSAPASLRRPRPGPASVHHALARVWEVPRAAPCSLILLSPNAADSHPVPARAISAERKRRRGGARASVLPRRRADRRGRGGGGAGASCRGIRGSRTTIAVLENARRGAAAAGEGKALRRRWRRRWRLRWWNWSSQRSSAGLNGAGGAASELLEAWGIPRGADECTLRRAEVVSREDAVLRSRYDCKERVDEHG